MFFDTANVYSDGTSKEIVGRALAEYADRDEIMLATKLNELTGDELTELEDPYRPHAVVGFD
ncbi:MAG: aldo/keto reductase [Pseudonocardiales bacterium]|nr:aldo/keto reductase [Pseudonocardiales bacterium]